MTKKNQNADVYEGDAKTLTVTVTKDGSAYDPTGQTIEYRVNAPANDTASIEKDNGGTGGVSITDGANGIFKITLSKTDTLIEPGRYEHQCRITDGGGDPETVFEGDFNVLDSNFH